MSNLSSPYNNDYNGKKIYNNKLIMSLDLINTFELNFRPARCRAGRMLFGMDFCTLGPKNLEPNHN